MDFQTFLNKATTPEFFSNTVYVFHGKSYPALFFSRLLAGLRQQAQVQYLSLNDLEPNQLAAQLGTAFLDQSLFYWLGDGTVLNAANKKLITNLLATYAGPHRVALFLDEPLKVESQHIVHIPLPDKIDRATYEQLAKILFPDSKQMPQLNRHIQQPPTLNTACLLISYEQLLGTNTEAFAKTWLQQINEPESSLFVLSQHLFAKQQSEFLRQWDHIGPQYNEQFWIIYIGEQLWRAYFYIQYRNNGQHLEAKKISARLPFSFMQRDWKKVTAPELAAAHDFLYQLDHNLKNGASPMGLNLFFNKFLAGQFGL